MRWGRSLNLWIFDTGGSYFALVSYSYRPWPLPPTSVMLARFYMILHSPPATPTSETRSLRPSISLPLSLSPTSATFNDPKLQHSIGCQSGAFNKVLNSSLFLLLLILQYCHHFPIFLLSSSTFLCEGPGNQARGGTRWENIVTCPVNFSQPCLGHCNCL